MNGTIETIVAAVSKAIEAGIGRKNMVAIVGIVTLATMLEAPLSLCLLVAGIAALAVLTQWSLDLYEVRRTGQDQVDNGVELTTIEPPIPATQPESSRTE